MRARHHSTRAALVAATVAVAIGTTAQSARASWAWKSAGTYSYAASECSAGGMGDSATSYSFGLGGASTGVHSDCDTTTAYAAALPAWQGGTGRDFIAPGTTGSFGPYTELGPVSDDVTVPSFTPGTTGITFSGAATVTQSGPADVEIGAFLFTGDPSVLEGMGPTDIEGLISLGIISQSDVLFDLWNASIPASFTYLPYNFAISSSQVDSVVFDAFAQSVPESSTWALMLIGFAALGLAGFSRGRVTLRLTDGS